MNDQESQERFDAEDMALRAGHIQQLLAKRLELAAEIRACRNQIKLKSQKIKEIGWEVDRLLGMLVGKK